MGKAALRMVFLVLALGLSTDIASANNVCLNDSQLALLGENVVCQQMVNPTACADLTAFLREERQATDNSIHLETVATLGVAAGVRAARASSPVVRSFISARAKMAELSTMIAALAGRSITEAEATAVSAKLQELRSVGGAHFSNLKAIPTRIGATQLTRALRRVAMPVARGAAAILFSGQLLLAAIIYEVGFTGSALYERFQGCSARVRNSYLFSCVTERCLPHITNCPNALNFVMQDFEIQKAYLDTDPQLCRYMKDILAVANQNMSDVTLTRCPSTDNGRSVSASVVIQNYQLSDLTTMNRAGWSPPLNENRQVTADFNFRGDQLSEVVTTAIPPIGNDESPFFVGSVDHFNYNEFGDMSRFSRNLLVNSVSQEGLEVREERWVGEYDLNTFIPPRKYRVYGIERK